MNRVNFWDYVCASILAVCVIAVCTGGGCKKGGSDNTATVTAGDYLGGMTSVATWPHTHGVFVIKPLDCCVLEPQGRGPAGYIAAVKSMNDWNDKAGIIWIKLRSDHADCTGADVVIHLSAEWTETGEPGTAPPSAPGTAGNGFAYGYTNVTLVTGQPADGQNGGTIAHAEIFIWGWDDTDNVEGALNHEFPRAAGEVTGFSPYFADVMSKGGTHGKPTDRDLKTLITLYTKY